MATLAELEPLATTTGAYAFVIVLGLLWGSFANVCIYRMPPTDEHPKGRSIVKPGSHCFACGAPVRWYDNVPLLAYLWLRGRCRDCHAGFSPRYLIVEAVTGAMFGVAWWAAVSAGILWEPFDVRLIRFVVYAAFVVVMIVIAFIDLDHKLILDRITYPAILAFYGLGMLLPDHVWYDGLIGAAVGYGIIWLVGEGYYLLTKREGLGLGDAKLLAVVGALLGWRGVYVSLLGGSVIGVAITLPVVMIRRKLRGPEPAEPPAPDEPAPDSAPEITGDASAAPPLRHLEVPFGVFLSLGALFYMVAEPWISLHFRFTGG